MPCAHMQNKAALPCSLLQNIFLAFLTCDATHTPCLPCAENIWLFQAPYTCHTAMFVWLMWMDKVGVLSMPYTHCFAIAWYVGACAHAHMLRMLCMRAHMHALLRARSIPLPYYIFVYFAFCAFMQHFAATDSFMPLPRTAAAPLLCVCILCQMFLSPYQNLLYNPYYCS